MFRTIEVKVGLGNKGKWTSEHDVSQDVYNYIYIYIYIHICKSEVSKTCTIVNALYIPNFIISCVLFLNCIC